MNRKKQSHTSFKHVMWGIVLGSLILASSSISMCSEDDQSTEEKTFLAGAAASNITPPLGGPIIGGWQPIGATHIHDDLYARCIVLDNQKTRLVFVVCDNLGLPAEVCEAAKELIHEKTEIPVKSIMISSTHTHSAVSARGPNRLMPDDQLNEYQQFIVTRIADGVRTALHNLQPARIGWGSAEEPTSVFNRRWFMKPGVPVPNPFGGEDQVRMNPPRGSDDLLKPAGPTDPEIGFLSIQSKDGNPIALLANYSLHYVGGVERGAVSADYFCMFSDRIQELLKADRLDPPFVGIMSNGTSGDINNINFFQKSSKRYERFEKMREVAELTAQAVYKAHQDIEFHDWVELGVRQEELSLSVRKPTQEQIAYSHKMLNKPEDAKPYHSREKVYAHRLIQLQDAPDEVEIVLQAFQIGDLGISTIPFEVFVEIGLELKEKSPFEQSFTISFGNGSFGYLPTVKQHQWGGYETWLGTNVVEKGASRKIIDTLLKLYKDL